MSRFQKGQSIVEFALILPFFFFLLWGFIYFGMLFSDYLMLNDMARSYAREASLESSETVTHQKQGYYTTEFAEECAKRQVTKLYTIDKDATSVTEDEQNTNDIKVTIKENLNQDGWVSTLRNFLGDSVVKQTIQIEYRMYWEAKGS